MDAWPTPPVPRLPGTGQPLALFDSARGGVYPTEPARPARMYVCGITPYDATHLGHAATMITFDLINRVWRDAGHPVCYVQNVTDIDDPLLERAARDREDWVVLAMRETALFREDMAALRIIAPEHYVGAVESIPDIAARVSRLLDEGAAYRLADGTGDVYFDVATAPRFGYESRLSREQMRELFAERGGDPDRPGKRDPLDPLLWRGARDGEPSWAGGDLGPGRPGWHIECATIALDLLGDRVEPMAVRLALLADHYRTDRQWTDDLLKVGEERLARWRAATGAAGGPSGAALLAAVRDRLADDLDTEGALRAVDTWADDTLTGEGTDTGAPALVAATVDALLGVRL